MARLPLLFLFLPACIGGLTTGAVMPVGPTPATPGGTLAARYTKPDEPTGVELRIFGATGGSKDNPLLPNAYGLVYRQIGDEHVQTAGQIGWAGAVRVGAGAVFGRIMFDAINSQRTLDGDRKFSAFSPTLDLGALPFKNGLCVSASATYDVHFNDPDRWVLGMFVGVCASDAVKR
jgi:hypothetical protein